MNLEDLPIETQNDIRKRFHNYLSIMKYPMPRIYIPVILPFKYVEALKTTPHNTMKAVFIRRKAANGTIDYVFSHID